MNDFTKEELQMLLGGISLWMEEIAILEKKGDPYDCLYVKLRSMIDNYREDPWDRKKIAQSHLQEASSLISHAMCLLGMKDE